MSDGTYGPLIMDGNMSMSPVTIELNVNLARKSVGDCIPSKL
jgi:hypothetical protein